MTAPNKEVRRPRGRWIRKLLLLGVSCAVALALTEAALWIFWPVRYHEWLTYVADGRIRARAEPGQVIENKVGAVIRINKLGFRGPEYAWQPAPGTLRILAFGGSSTFCFENSSEAATWPARLETMLADRLKMPVEVVNLGMPGFDGTQSKANYMFLGRDLNPHVCMQYDGWNDMKWFRLLDQAPQPFTAWVPNKPWWQKLARATQIGRYARNAAFRYQGRKLQMALVARDKLNPDDDKPLGPAGFSWARHNYDDFARLVRSDGRLPVLISQASLLAPSSRGKFDFEIADGLSSMYMSFPVFWEAFQKLRAIVKETAGAHDAIFIDAAGQIPPDKEHFFDDVHFTDHGAEVMARLIADALLADARFMRVVETVRTGATSRP
ncbi:MAG: GDSL-type esterase/lipase family protein [Phycisphaerae bacterium]